MGGRTKRKNKRKQLSNAAKQHRPRACRPAADEVLALRQALQSAKKTVQKLASINTNLMNQVKELRRMEISWVKEKGKLKHANVIIQRTLGRKYTHARNEINRLEEVLKAAETNITFRKKEEEEEEEEMVTVDEVQAEGVMGKLGEEIIPTELKEMHEKCQGQEVVITKKEKVITRFQREMLALTKEHVQTVAELSQKEDAHNASERQWKTKCEALEARLKEEVAEREEREKELASKKKKRLFCFLGKRNKNEDSDQDKHDAV